MSPRALPALLLLAAALAAAPAAAQPLSVQAFVDKTTVGDAEEVRLTVEVRGGFRSLDRIEPPAVRGLSALADAPAQQWTRRQRGARTEHEVTLTWTFLPTGSGRGEIGPVGLIVDGRRYTTDPITVRVVPQRQRPSTGATPPGGAPPPAEPAADAPDLFIAAVPDRTTAYVGEQVVVEYVLHYAPSVHPRNARLAGAWDAAGFWREELELPGAPVARSVTVDGRPYEAVTIKRTAFFPARAGALTVDSLVVELEALQGQRAGGVYGPLYNPFAARYRRVRLAAPPVAIEARALPPGAPGTFGGAVGQFDLRVEVDRTEVAAGDPIRVTLRLRGDGNPGTIAPPPWGPGPAFEAYPPRDEVHLTRSDRRLRGERRLTYTVVPREAASELAGVEWSFFDPAAGVYRTARSEPVPLRVRGAVPAVGVPPPAEASAALPAEAGRWRPVRAHVPWHRRPLVILAFGLPALALLLLAGAVRWRDRRDPAPSDRAAREARAALAAAAALRRTDPAAYLDALDRALRGFLSARYGTPASALPLGPLHEALLARGLPETGADRVTALLAALDAARFAPPGAAPAVPSPEEVAGVIEGAALGAPETPRSPRWRRPAASGQPPAGEGRGDGTAIGEPGRP